LEEVALFRAGDAVTLDLAEGLSDFEGGHDVTSDVTRESHPLTSLEIRDITRVNII
jgi:hypothetical protein